MQYALQFSLEMINKEQWKQIERDICVNFVSCLFMFRKPEGEEEWKH